MLQDLFTRKGAQKLQILKDVNGVLKPVSSTSAPLPTCAACRLQLISAGTSMYKAAAVTSALTDAAKPLIVSADAS